MWSTGVNIVHSGVWCCAHMVHGALCTHGAWWSLRWCSTTWQCTLEPSGTYRHTHTLVLGGTPVCTLFTVGQDDSVLYHGRLCVQHDSVQQRSEGSGVQGDSSNSWWSLRTSTNGWKLHLAQPQSAIAALSHSCLSHPHLSKWLNVPHVGFIMAGPTLYQATKLFHR